jgi:bifunctional non-homologous end joining protein LigD
VTDRLEPMLATPSTEAEVRDGYVYEFKWDGVRALAATDGETVVLRSRRGNDITARYPELAGIGAAVGTQAVLDGEVVAFDPTGAPSFARLQRRMNVADAARIAMLVEQIPVAYLVFDVLSYDGRDLTGEPYTARRDVLEEIGLSDARWQVPPRGDDLDAMLHVARQRGFEGIVAKRPDSPYRCGRRTPDWRKVRLLTRQELVVGGYRPGEGSRGGRFGSLLVGHYDDTGLRYAGAVGSGFTDRELDRLQAQLDARRRDDSPFVDPVPIRDAVFVDPAMVVEVQFSEWTPDGLLRQPSYKGQRDDKDPTAVVRET